tara:strand:- start:2007 stop:2183 length:177 start_codon:yes stop_codon:yes gene_type:complete
MKNPFKKIALPPQEVPKELKNKVMDDVARIKLLMDMTDLFTSNFSSAAKSILKKPKKQ